RYGQLNDRSPKADATHHVHAAAGRGTTSASSVAADARASTRARLPARLIAGRPRRRESATARPRNARTSRTPSLAPSGRAGNAHGEPRLERRRPERLAEPKHEQPRDERGEEHGLAADQEEDGEPQVVERRTPRRGLALRTVAAARGRGWWQHGPVRPVRDRTALGRRLEQARRHQRTPTRNEA